MAKGLRNHYHQYYELKSKEYFDSKRGCKVKKITYSCMICGREYVDTYECSNNVIMNKK